MVEHLCFCIVSMVECKQFNYLYLGKLGKLANPTKRISENLKRQSTAVSATGSKCNKTLNEFDSKGNKMEKVQLIYIMLPSVPFTYSWSVSWLFCPSFEQRAYALFSTKCHNYGWRFSLFTSFQFINHERSRGTLSSALQKNV